MTSPAHPVLAILAGGEGSRMGHAKALLRVSGVPILEFLLDRFAWPGPVWLITAPGREHPPGCERFDRELIDPAPGLGPLRGILTALEQVNGHDLVVSAIDMPAVTTEALQWLAGELRRRPDMLGVMCRRPAGQSERIEPFPLALRPGAAPVIRRRLATGRNSVRGMTEEPGIVALPSPSDWPATMWLNLNDPPDLRRIAEGLR